MHVQTSSVAQGSAHACPRYRRGGVVGSRPPTSMTICVTRTFSPGTPPPSGALRCTLGREKGVDDRAVPEGRHRVLLVAAGALMWAASWQRWAGACAWAQDEGGACLRRQDHLYDFIAPRLPGNLSATRPSWPGPPCWSRLSPSRSCLGTDRPPSRDLHGGGAPRRGARPGLGGRRHALVGTERRRGSSDRCRPGRVPLAPVAAALLVRFAIPAHGWARWACILLVLAGPLVASLSYAVGPTTPSRVGGYVRRLHGRRWSVPVDGRWRGSRLGPAPAADGDADADADAVISRALADGASARD